MTKLRSEKQEEWDRRELAKVYLCIYIYAYTHTHTHTIWGGGGGPSPYCVKKKGKKCGIAVNSPGTHAEKYCIVGLYCYFYNYIAVELDRRELAQAPMRKTTLQNCTVHNCGTVCYYCDYIYCPDTHAEKSTT